MQMRRWNYLTKDRAATIAALRRDAAECERAGFSLFAAWNHEVAQSLIPPPPRASRTEETR